LAAGRRRIVNLSTSVVRAKLPTYGVCAATKAALEVMSDILSKANPLERLGQPEDIADTVDSSPTRTAAGSTARPCAPTAAWCERGDHVLRDPDHRRIARVRRHDSPRARGGRSYRLHFEVDENDPGEMGDWDHDFGYFQGDNWENYD